VLARPLQENFWSPARDVHHVAGAGRHRAGHGARDDEAADPGGAQRTDGHGRGARPTAAVAMNFHGSFLIASTVFFTVSATFLTAFFAVSLTHLPTPPERHFLAELYASLTEFVLLLRPLDRGVLDDVPRLWSPCRETHDPTALTSFQAWPDAT
jgi:hypothetical protein